MGARIVVAALLFASAGPALSEESYKIDPLHTAATFSVKHLGLSQQRGSFGRTTGTVTLDRGARKGSIDVTIDAASITSGSAPREAMLKGEDYFNVAQFPTITFKSVNLKFDGDNVVGADGDLTIRGVSRPVVLSVADFKCVVHPSTKKPACGAEVSATIKRSEFGMTKNQASTADDVHIAVAVEAIQQ
ncbi:MAG TPA: YceI family protein [Casimicrobiaceae bacterium]|nr:YceI family protein [Casimicrobiaceae bacterium]